MAQKSWKEWTPPNLDQGNITLSSALRDLPGNNPEDISLLVKLFENPSSPISFTGAINLERHDCVHIILGRGLLAQDEAFVIGFTMGTAYNISKIKTSIFKLITKYVYPYPYNFSDDDLKIYDLGVKSGINSGVSNIYDFPFEDSKDLTLAEIRNILNIDIDFLKEIYRKEKELLPKTQSSMRLDIN